MRGSSTPPRPHACSAIRAFRSPGWSIGRPTGLRATCRASASRPPMAHAMALSDPAWVIGPKLTVAELPAADALVAEAGWNQVAADWRIFLDFGTVHAVRTAAGRVIA